MCATVFAFHAKYSLFAQYSGSQARVCMHGYVHGCIFALKSKFPIFAAIALHTHTLVTVDWYTPASSENVERLYSFSVNVKPIAGTYLFQGSTLDDTLEILSRSKFVIVLDPSIFYLDFHIYHWCYFFLWDIHLLVFRLFWSLRAIDRHVPVNSVLYD